MPWEHALESVWEEDKALSKKGEFPGSRVLPLVTQLKDFHSPKKVDTVSVLVTFLLL